MKQLVTWVLIVLLGAIAFGCGDDESSDPGCGDLCDWICDDDGCDGDLIYCIGAFFTSYGYQVGYPPCEDMETLSDCHSCIDKIGVTDELCSGAQEDCLDWE